MAGTLRCAAIWLAPPLPTCLSSPPPCPLCRPSHSAPPPLLCPRCSYVDPDNPTSGPRTAQRVDFAELVRQEKLAALRAEEREAQLAGLGRGTGEQQQQPQQRWGPQQVPAAAAAVAAEAVAPRAGVVGAAAAVRDLEAEQAALRAQGQQRAVQQAALRLKEEEEGKAAAARELAAQLAAQRAQQRQAELDAALAAELADDVALAQRAASIGGGGALQQVQQAQQQPTLRAAVLPDPARQVAARYDSTVSSSPATGEQEIAAWVESVVLEDAAAPPQAQPAAAPAQAAAAAPPTLQPQQAQRPAAVPELPPQVAVRRDGTVAADVTDEQEIDAWLGGSSSS